MENNENYDPNCRQDLPDREMDMHHMDQDEHHHQMDELQGMDQMDQMQEMEMNPE